MSKWNVNSSITIEELLDEDFPDTFPRDITNIDIDFNSQGYYTPASMYGGTDHTGWPEEGDDERTMIEVKAFDDDGKAIELTTVQQQELFDKYENRVNEADLPEDEQDDREFRRDYDDTY